MRKINQRNVRTRKRQTFVTNDQCCNEISKFIIKRVAFEKVFSEFVK